MQMALHRTTSIITRNLNNGPLMFHIHMGVACSHIFHLRVGQSEDQTLVSNLPQFLLCLQVVLPRFEDFALL